MNKITLIILLIFAFNPTRAEDHRKSLYRCGSGTVQQALAGDQIQLTSGEQVMMLGIKAPTVHRNQGGQVLALKSWPFAVKSMQMLSMISKGKDVSLYCEGRRKDYKGRRVAHVFLDKSFEPLSFALLTKGAVWAYPYKRQVKLTGHMYSREDTARQAKIGLWEMQQYQSVSALNVDALKAGEFKTVSGKVVKASVIKKLVYLNFGHNIYKDFTVKIELLALKKLLGLGKDEFLDLDTVKGKNMMARGWVSYQGGPMITVTEFNRLRMLN